MKGTGLAKLYDELSADERFRLRIRALARGDRADCDRLDRACPRRNYSALDHRYTDWLDASDALTLCVMMELGPALARLRMVDTLRQLAEHVAGQARDLAAWAYFDGHRAGWQAAGGAGDGADVPDAALGDVDALADRLGTRLQDVVDALAQASSRAARTPRDAFAAFCQDELDLTPEDVLGAWARPALAELAHFRAALDAAEPDAEGVRVLHAVLRLAWRQRALGITEGGLDDLDAAARAALEQARADTREGR